MYGVRPYYPGLFPHCITDAASLTGDSYGKLMTPVWNNKIPIAGWRCFRYNVHYVETFVFLERTVAVLDKKVPEIRLNGHERYYFVREDILPEALIKTVQAKELLARGEVKTVNEAVEQVELSRSAFYKYKDGIYPLSKLERERIVTISMDLEHRSGILSKVLAMIADLEGNVLTIHQTIPLQGVANVVISVETSQMDENIAFLLERLRGQDGVSRASLVGQG